MLIFLDTMEKLSWREHFAAKEPIKAFIIFIIILLIVFWVAFSFKDILIAIFSGLLLFGSVFKYFFPTEYFFDEEGVNINFLVFKTHHSWQKFKGVFLCKTGVLLSPFSKPHRLDTFRGVFLLCKENHKEVYEFAKQKIAGKE